MCPRPKQPPLLRPHIYSWPKFVIAARWYRPLLRPVTLVWGMNSFSPNKVRGIWIGFDDFPTLGPKPKSPNPQTKTAPSSEITNYIFKYKVYLF